jgi:hypothetical protein
VLNQTNSRALVAGAIAVAIWTSPALADRVLNGAEAHQMLSGQTFEFNCVDGTRGEASYAKSGVATASFRLAGAGDDAAVQRDHGRVRAEGENLCVRWGTLNGGKEGCYKMVERRPGMYRISEGQLRWCELTARRSATERASND